MNFEHGSDAPIEEKEGLKRGLIKQLLKVALTENNIGTRGCIHKSVCVSCKSKRKSKKTTTVIELQRRKAAACSNGKQFKLKSSR